MMDHYSHFDTIEVRGIEPENRVSFSQWVMCCDRGYWFERNSVNGETRQIAPPIRDISYRLT